MWIIASRTTKGNGYHHPFYFLIFMFVYFWEIETQSLYHRVSWGGAERDGNKTRSRLQALSCQHRAWCGAQTHTLRDHDLSRSRPPNRLSHPGDPKAHILITFNFLFLTKVWITFAIKQQYIYIHMHTYILTLFSNRTDSIQAIAKKTITLYHKSSWFNGLRGDAKQKFQHGLRTSTCLSRTYSCRITHIL